MWKLTENKDWDYLESQFDWVKRMETVPQDFLYHAEGDVAIHTQMVIKELLADPEYQELSEQEQEIMWAAALFHDVEKYSTTVTEEDGSITSKGHAKKGAITTRKILYRKFNCPFEIREQIVNLVRYHGLPIWFVDKPSPVRSTIMASLEVNTKLLVMLARADMKGRICTDQEDMLFRVQFFEEFCRDYNCFGQPRQFANPEARMYYLNNIDTFIEYVPYPEETGEVIIMCGLPGAGKSTYVKKNFSHLPIISLDQIRIERMNEKGGNGAVIQTAKERARTYCRKYASFVWDSTNYTKMMREQLIALFRQYKMKIRIVYIEVPLKTMHEQNLSRESSIPSFAIDRMIGGVEIPTLCEAEYVDYIVKS